MTRRERRENSAIFRTYQELFPGKDHTVRAPDRSRSPHLFSVFLDQSYSVKKTKSVSFAVDLNVLVPDYEIDGKLFMKRHYEGGFIFREQILVEAFPDANVPGGWRIKYGFQDKTPGKANKPAETAVVGADSPIAVATDGTEGITFEIPIEQKTNPGLKGTLRMEARPWT